jgi:hypothetical protein
MSDTMIFREGPISGTPTYQTASLISTDLANKSLTLTSSSHVEINDSAFNISGAKSFEFWVNVNDTSVRQAFMGKQNQAGDFDGWNIRVSQTGNDRKLHFIIRVAGGNQLSVRGSTVLSDATKYHVVVTYDGSTNVSGVKMFIDAVEETKSTDEDTLSSHPSPSTLMMIGAGGGTAGTNALEYSGVMDDVSVYNSVLSPAQVSAHYNAA